MEVTLNCFSVSCIVRLKRDIIINTIELRFTLRGIDTKSGAARGSKMLSLRTNSFLLR